MRVRTVIIYFFLISFAGSPVIAQNLSQTIKGTIVDKDSKVPLWGAIVAVYYPLATLVSQTDSTGYFRLNNVPVGRHTLKVTYLGYEEITLPEVLVSTGKELVLNIEMEEKVSKFGEVTVRAEKSKAEPLNSMATVSARSFNVEETGRYAACINDPARMAQSFAGVSSNGDETNEIIVRGNSPRGLLWKMEGIEIPNPNHFSNGEGNSGGGVSMISNNLLSNSDFYTGAFPAEYGNAISGVFDINMRKGNSDKHEYAFQLGVLGMEVAAEGPFSNKNKSSYLFSYRYSTLDFLYQIGLNVAGNIVPKYQDTQFNIYLPGKHFGKFNFWGLGGMSNTANNAIKDSAEWKTYQDKLNYNDLHKTGVLGLSHMFPFKGNRSYLKTVIAVSAEQNISTADTLNNEYILRPIARDTFTYIISRISTSWNYKINSRNVVRSGIIYGNYHYTLFVKSLNDTYGVLETFLGANGSTGLAEVFTQWQNKSSEKITINTGLHCMYFLLNKRYTIEPRLGFRYQLSKKMTISTGAGFHSKIESISNYLAEKQLSDGTVIMPNKQTNLTRAIHAVAGYDYLIQKDLRLKTEIYYQYLYDVPVEDSLSSFSALNYSGGFTNTAMISSGTGYNKGIDLTVEKFFTNSYYFLFTASLYDSKYRGSDGVLRNTLYNGKYLCNVLAGREFKTGNNKNNIFNINVRSIWKGGNRLTPIDKTESFLQKKTVYLENRAFNTRSPSYFRIDLQLSFRKNKEHYSWIVTLDFENLTNRKNIYNEYWDTKTNSIRNNYNLGILPVLNFKIEF